MLSKDAREKEKQEEYDHFYNSTDTQNINGATNKQCMYLTRSILKTGTNVEWGVEEDQGYDSLIRTSIYQKAQSMKDNKYEKNGVLQSGSNEFILHELHSGNIPKGNSQYIRYAFSARTCNSPLEGNLICLNCDKAKKAFRTICRKRYRQDAKEIHSCTNNTKIVHSSPTKALKKIETVADSLHSLQKRNHYLELRLEEQRVKHGVSLKASMYGELFDDEAQKEADNIFNAKGKQLASKQLLSRILWNQSLQATLDAKMKGKRQVRYHPIMIRFAMMIRHKLNRGTYDMSSEMV